MLAAIAEAEGVANIEKYSGWRLHPLTGRSSGYMEHDVTRNFRLTFRLVERSVVEIDLEDYHGR